MNNNIDDLIDKIHGNINLNTPTSGYDSFIPIHNDGKTTAFTIAKGYDKIKHTYEEEVENDEDYRSRPSGAFFPFVNENNIDLTDYQKFNTFDLDNHHDSCFFSAHVFTKIEIESLRSMVRTRFLPNYQIKKLIKNLIVILLYIALMKLNQFISKYK